MVEALSLQINAKKVTTTRLLPWVTARRWPSHRHLLFSQGRRLGLVARSTLFRSFYWVTAGLDTSSSLVFLCLGRCTGVRFLFASTLVVYAHYLVACRRLAQFFHFSDQNARPSAVAFCPFICNP